MISIASPIEAVARDDMGADPDLHLSSSGSLVLRSGSVLHDFSSENAKWELHPDEIHTPADSTTTARQSVHVNREAEGGRSPTPKG
jgi:hypothetical protein